MAFSMSRRVTSVGAAICLATGMLLGCESERPAGPPVFPVQGELRFDGEPMTGASVTFHRTGEGAETGSYYPRATVDEQGVYRLSTFVSDDGAPAGDYVVTVYWPDPKVVARDPYGESEQLPPDLLRRRFATPEASNLRARIPTAPTRLAPVDLSDRAVKQAEQFSLMTEPQ